MTSLIQNLFPQVEKGDLILTESQADIKRDDNHHKLFVFQHDSGYTVDLFTRGCVVAVSLPDVQKYVQCLTIASYADDEGNIFRVLPVSIDRETGRRLFLVNTPVAVRKESKTRLMVRVLPKLLIDDFMRDCFIYTLTTKE